MTQLQLHCIVGLNASIKNQIQSNTCKKRIMESICNTLVHHINDASWAMLYSVARTLAPRSHIRLNLMFQAGFLSCPCDRLSQLYRKGDVTVCLSGVWQSHRKKLPSLYKEPTNKTIVAILYERESYH